MKPICLLFLALSVFAQQQPGGQQLNQYQQAADILRGAPAPATPAHRKAKPAPEKREADFSTALIAHREIPLSPAARLALSVSDEIQAAGSPPVAGPDGRVVFIYGHSSPTVVCATFQICEIDLEPGETISKDAIDIGDNRFQVTAREAGSGAAQFPYLIVKPTEAGLDTSLAVGTTVRPYYLRLVSTDREHMARVAFSYPDDDARKAKAAQDAARGEADRQKAEAERLAKLSAPRPLRNWNYTVTLHGKDAAWLKPVSIADDGIHTRIALTDSARSRGLPVVVLSDERGSIPANARWDGNELIVDALFQHACLLEGVGKKQQRACIDNGGLK